MTLSQCTKYLFNNITNFFTRASYILSYFMSICNRIILKL